jgi:ABC-2 type transport system permease protein
LGKIGSFSFLGLILYILLIFNAFVIATAFHIAVLAIGILTTEVDNTIMLYRDITRVGMMPIDIYHEPLRSFLTFVIPVGIMMSFPVKVLLGLLSWWGVVSSLILGAIFLGLSLKFWGYALNQYSSASS